MFSKVCCFLFFPKVYWKKKSREKSIQYTRVFCAMKLQMHLYVESFLWIEFENKFFYLLFGCLWDISEPFLKGHFFSFWPEDHQECCEKVVPLNLEDRLVGFKQRNFWFNCNILVNYTTLCRLCTIYVSNSMIRLMVEFCWLTKFVFQVFCVFFLKLKGHLAPAYESYASGILIVILIKILNDYYFFN